jgi:hypothetical protein
MILESYKESKKEDDECNLSCHDTPKSTPHSPASG